MSTGNNWEHQMDLNKWAGDFDEDTDVIDRDEDDGHCDEPRGTCSIHLRYAQYDRESGNSRTGQPGAQ